jgi:hypothetical protein
MEKNGVHVKCITGLYPSDSGVRVGGKRARPWKPEHQADDRGENPEFSKATDMDALACVR